MVAVSASAQTPSPSTHGTIRGTVVDARDGTPLEKVSVRVQTAQDARQTTVTGSDGRFQLDASRLVTTSSTCRRSISS